VIPDKVLDSILTGGPWAALFIMSVIIFSSAVTILWRALREADNRTCETREQCDAELHKINQERITELKLIIEVGSNNTNIVKELARSVEARGSAISQMAETLTKLGHILEGNQVRGLDSITRMERSLSDLSERLSRVWITTGPPRQRNPEGGP
jgi:hypothetical protein